MTLLTDLRTYKFYTFQIILLFTILFISITLIPFYIENQQSFLIGDKLQNLPYDDMVQNYDISNLSYYIPTIKQNKDVSFVQFFSSLQYYQFEVKNPQGFVYNTSESVPYRGLNLISFDNESFSTLQKNNAININHSLSDNEIIIDSITANELQVIKGDNISFTGSTWVSLGSNSYTTVKDNKSFIFTIVDIVDDLFTNSKFNFLIYSNFQNQPRYSLFGIINENMISMLFSREAPSYSYVLRQTLIVKYRFQTYSSDYLVNQYTYYKLKSIQFQSILKPDYQPNLYDYYNSPSLELITNALQDLASLQIYFLLLQIPLTIILFSITSYLISYWLDARKKELFVLYKSGASITTISENIKRNINFFLFLGIVLSGIIITSVAFILNIGIESVLLLFIIFGIIYICFVQIYLYRLPIDRKTIDIKLQKPLEETEYVQSRGNMKKNFLMVLGCSIIAISFLIFFSSQFFLLKPDPIINTFVFILTPLVGIYGSTRLLFWIVDKNSSRIKKHSFSFFFGFILEDLLRNKDEIFRLFLFLTLAFTFIFGPIIANDTINANTQTQLQILYGSDYSTGFYSNSFNYSYIKSQLDAIPDISWTLILKTNANVNMTQQASNNSIQLQPQLDFLAYGSVISLYFIDSNYLQTINPKTPNLIDSLNLLNKNTFIYNFYTGTYPSSYFGTAIIPNLLTLDYSFNLTSKTNKLINKGEIDHVPGAFLSGEGFLPPYSSKPWYQIPPELSLFTKLTDSSFIIDNNYKINFLFKFKGNDITETLSELYPILNHKININKDNKTNLYNYPPDDLSSYQNLAFIRNNVTVFALTIITILIGIFLILFANKFLFVRQHELGIFRTKGYSTYFIFKLLSIEFLFVLVTASIWSFIQAVLFSFTIAVGAIVSTAVPISFAISIGSIEMITGTIIIFIILVILISTKLMKSKIDQLLDTRANK